MQKGDVDLVYISLRALVHRPDIISDCVSRKDSLFDELQAVHKAKKETGYLPMRLFVGLSAIHAHTQPCSKRAGPLLTMIWDLPV